LLLLDLFIFHLLAFFLFHFLNSCPFPSSCHQLYIRKTPFASFCLTSSAPSASSKYLASPFHFMLQYFDQQSCELNWND
jgi:hypothetical protein